MIVKLASVMLRKLIIAIQYNVRKESVIHLDIKIDMDEDIPGLPEMLFFLIPVSSTISSQHN